MKRASVRVCQFISLNFNIMENNENPLLLKQAMILTFLFHKSVAIYDIYSNSVSNFKLNSLLVKP